MCLALDAGQLLDSIMALARISPLQSVWHESIGLALTAPRLPPDGRLLVRSCGWSGDCRAPAGTRQRVHDCVRAERHARRVPRAPPPFPGLAAQEDRCWCGGTHGRPAVGPPAKQVGGLELVVEGVRVSSSPVLACWPDYVGTNRALGLRSPARLASTTYPPSESRPRDAARGDRHAAPRSRLVAPRRRRRSETLAVSARGASSSRRLSSHASRAGGGTPEYARRVRRVVGGLTGCPPPGPESRRRERKPLNQRRDRARTSPSQTRPFRGPRPGEQVALVGVHPRSKGFPIGEFYAAWTRRCGPPPRLLVGGEEAARSAGPNGRRPPDRGRAAGNRPGLRSVRAPRSGSPRRRGRTRKRRPRRHERRAALVTAAGAPVSIVSSGQVRREGLGRGPGFGGAIRACGSTTPAPPVVLVARRTVPPPAGAGSVVNRCGGGWSAVADAPSAPSTGATAPAGHPSSPPSPWSAGAGGGLQWTPYQRAARSDAFTRGLGDHRRCPNPAELTVPGSAWSPNARWARIRTHWNALGRAQSVSTDGGLQPLGSS